MPFDKNKLDDHVLDHYAIHKLSKILSQEEIESLAWKQMMNEMKSLRINDPQRLLDEMEEDSFIKFWNECHC